MDDEAAMIQCQRCGQEVLSAEAVVCVEDPVWRGCTLCPRCNGEIMGVHASGRPSGGDLSAGPAGTERPSEQIGWAAALLIVVVGLPVSWLAGILTMCAWAGDLEMLLDPFRYIESSIYTAFCFPIQVSAMISGGGLGAIGGRFLGNARKGAVWGVLLGLLAAIALAVMSGLAMQNYH